MEINAAEVLKFLTDGNQRDLSGKEQFFLRGEETLILKNNSTAVFTYTLI